ncbi:MAG: carboxy terminal-processing peptidase [Gammaproteobacteria bacterium AqS3]|nr:carboxy terminal-processing peptidase [Gammaproteobacteria bacterium AqS3]
MTWRLRPSVQLLLLGALIGALSLSSLPGHAAGGKAVSESWVQVAPDPEWGALAGQILTQVNHRHYRPVDWNDAEQRSKIFEAYIDALDSGATLLSAEDVQQYEKTSDYLLLQVLQGNFSTVLGVYNRYLERQQERLHHQIVQLETNGLPSLESDEHLLIDRDEAPRAPDDASLQKLWERMLRHDAINLRMEEPDLSDQEIVERLDKRYRTYLKRLERTDADDVFQTFINSLLSLYDPHTAYFAQDDSEDFEINMSGKLEGIGALLRGDIDFVRIEEISPGGPAQRDGRLQPGDRISGVGQGEEGEMIDVAGWDISEVVRRIRGTKGSTVRIRVLREGGESREISLVRDTIKLESRNASSRVVPLTYRDREWKIGVIALPSFYVSMRPEDGSISAGADVARELAVLEQAKVDGVLLDLRYNSGGSLDEATKIAGLFLGRRVVVQVQQRSGSTVLEQNRPIQTSRLPMGVMINPFSASASEIVAAAIQDYARGIVIGQRSHGKGTVQDVRFFGEGLLRVTFAKFFRINGTTSQRRGVLPDVELPTVHNTDELGERQYPTALTSTVIAPLYRTALSEPQRSELQRLSRERLEMPKYSWLKRQRERYQTMRERDTVPLSLSKRLAERDTDRNLQVDIENERAQVNNRPPFADFDALEEWRTAERALDPEEREDHELEQALHALIDHVLWQREKKSEARVAASSDEREQRE